MANAQAFAHGNFIFFPFIWLLKARDYNMNHSHSKIRCNATSNG